MKRSFARSAVLLSTLWAPTLCQITSLPTQENFLRRAFHSSTIRGNFLYIDGGEVNQIDYSTGTATYFVSTQNTTLSIDLSSSWTNSSVTINSISKGGAPVVNEEWLWNDPDGKTFYVFGGGNSPLVARPHPDHNLWAFKPNGQGGGSWSKHGAVPSSLIRTSGALVARSGNGIGYAIGGKASGAVQGMVEYNMATHSWTNSSTIALSTNGTAADGQLIFSPVFGEKGILIALGGSDGTTGESATLNDFSAIEIYDVNSGTWYTQPTSGTPPSARITFCAVASHGKSSLEIFIHGGFGGFASLAYDDVYVLSLPSFSWYKADYTPGVGRTLHTCNALNRNMVVIGGTSNDVSWQTGNDATGTQSYKDPWPWGLGVFDMSNMQWASEFNPGTGPYTTPDMVVAGIAANGSEPAKWSSDALKSVFAQTTLTTGSSSSNSSSGSGTTSSSGSSAPSSSSSSGTTSSSSLSSGAIAGIVIGVVALLLLGLGAFFFLRRSKRRSRAGHNPYPREENAFAMTHSTSGKQSPTQAPLIEIDGVEREDKKLPAELDGGKKIGRGRVELP